MCFNCKNIIKDLELNKRSRWRINNLNLEITSTTQGTPNKYKLYDTMYETENTKSFI